MEQHIGQDTVVPTLRLNEFAHQYDRSEYSPHDDVAKVYEKARPAVVQILMDGDEHGSGFFIDKNGKIATAFHCVFLSTKYQVRTADNRVLDAVVTGSSAAKDVAFLQVVDQQKGKDDTASAKNHDFPYLKFRETTSDLKNGDLLIALGHPKEWPDVYASPGTFKEIAPASSTGFLPINALGRDDLLPVIVAEMHTEPGNSGGPVVDKNGDVVGLSDAGSPRQLQAIMAETIRMGMGENVKSHYSSYLPHTLDWGDKATFLVGEALLATMPLLRRWERAPKIVMGSLGAIELVSQDAAPFITTMKSGTISQKVAWSANIAGDTMMIGSMFARRPAVSLAIGLSGIGIKLANQVLDKRRLL